MSDTTIDTLGFSIDTAPIAAFDTLLRRLIGTVNAADAALAKMQATANAAMKNVPAAFGGGGGQAVASAATSGAAAQTALNTAPTGATAAVSR